MLAGAAQQSLTWNSEPHTVGTALSHLQRRAETLFETSRELRFSGLPKSLPLRLSQFRLVWFKTRLYYCLMT